MTDDAVVMDRVAALYDFHQSILALELCWLERRDLEEIEQGYIRIYNLLKKYRNRNRA